MKLSQSETIQILRKRAGLNQAELGSRAFNTNIDSGRTKIKNIELGKQRPSDEDLKQMARCLDVPIEVLEPSSGNNQARANAGDLILPKKVALMFPDLREYLEMLDKASEIDDYDLIDYLSKKIADIWRNGPNQDMERTEEKTEKTL